MKPARLVRLGSVLGAFAARAGHLALTVGDLVLSGRADILCAALRRRLVSLREKNVPIEYLTPPTVGSKAIASGVNRAVEHESPSSAPLVSVIIPCFNYGLLLERAIISILAQTLTEIEIIVVEGGSTDGVTPGIVRALDLPKTRVIIQDKPTLVGANRNAGIAAARGRFICCLDADDTVDATYLEKAVYLLEVHLHDIVSTGIRFAGARSGTIDILETPDLRDMTYGNHVTTCAVFRRSLWEDVGGYFDTGKGQDHVAEDWDFWLRCVAAGARVCNITGEYLFNYTVHEGGSLSSTDVREITSQKKLILERNKALLTPTAFARSKSQARRRIIRLPVADLPQPPAPVPTAKRSLLIVVPFMIVGGAERLLSSVVRQLVARGWHVTVVSTLPQKELEDASDWFREATGDIYVLPQFLKEWQYAGFLHYIIQRRRFDVTLLAGSRLLYELLPELSANYRGMAIVDLLFNTVGHTHSHVQYRPHLTYAIAENPEVVSWLKKQGWANDRVSLVESGVDVATFDTKRSPGLVEELAIGPDEIVVGFSGRLSEEKAPEVFLKLVAAFRGEPSVRFIMTGGGPLRERIKSEIKKLPLGSRLQFRGLVASTKEYFATYDVFVLPSRIDGRPIAVMEALASGCAVVASDVGGIPALLQASGAGILCRPANTMDFVKAIRSLISDRNKLAAMKVAARETASRMLSVKQMGSAYEAVLEEAIRIRRTLNDADPGGAGTAAPSGAQIL